jgi:hypothetical protein
MLYFNLRNRRRFGLTAKANSQTYSDESFFNICGSLPGSTTTSELRFLTTKPCSWHGSFYTSQASLSTIGLMKTSISAVGLNVRRRGSNVMLTPERIFVVQIDNKVNGSTTNILSGVNIADQINVETWISTPISNPRPAFFAGQINVETWISTPISNPRFRRTRNIFSTTMLTHR